MTKTLSAAVTQKFYELVANFASDHDTTISEVVREAVTAFMRREIGRKETNLTLTDRKKVFYIIEE